MECSLCKVTTVSPLSAKKEGWEARFENNSWIWHCPQCQAELKRQSILYRINGDADEVEEAHRDIVSTVVSASGNQVGTYFAGHFEKDDIRQESIEIRFGGDVATDFVYERDIDKFKAQAAHYTNGNVARFILLVFNQFVDRYEKW